MLKLVAVDGLGLFSESLFSLAARGGRANSIRPARLTWMTLLAVLLCARLVRAEVPAFLDEFNGPTLDPQWTVLSPTSHPGFNGAGQYVVNGVLRADSGLRRSMGGQGSFVAEVSLELGPFFLSGSGGTKSDLKFRFTGSGGLVEVVLNSFKKIRVYSSQLGGNIAERTLSALSDNDRLDLQVGFLDVNGSVEVKYGINGGAWVELASATGISGYLDGHSDIVFFKFGSSPATLPQMRLDRYEVRDNPAANQVPVANADTYTTPRDAVLVVPAPGVLTNDTHPLDLPISAQLVSNAMIGNVTLTSDGAFTYSPFPGYSGRDEFTYRVTDGRLVSAPATVAIQVERPPLAIVDFEVVSGAAGNYQIQWNSESERTYTILGATNLPGPWTVLATHVAATPPTNTYVLNRPWEDFEAFRVMEEGPQPWPNTDYCALMSQEVQGKKCGFLAGNLVYYIGGNHGWKNPNGETIGLTHPFFHDLRCRGQGMVTNEATGFGHSLTGWEFWKYTKVAYGTVIIGNAEYPNPAPIRMVWRPDRMICEYKVDGVFIREDKFISTNDVACSIIKSSSPIQIWFEGQSFASPLSIRKTATLRYDTNLNMIHIVEGGTALARPVEGLDVEGTLMYDGMSSVVSASKNFASTYHGFRDNSDGRQKYVFTVPCDAGGVAVCWGMDDVFEKVRDRVQSVLDDPEGHLAAKKAYMNDLLNNQIPYFRCSDQEVVDIYYYLWALYLMYYIDVQKGWEQYPHTQTAVNNFLGMHRYDAAFQIRVGAWTTDKPYYAYGNVLHWAPLLPFAKSGGRLPDNKGTTWHSGIYGATTDHVNGAWEIFRRTGDTNFLAACYEPYFKPLFWNGITEHWGYMFNAAENLARMAEVLGHPADAQHWRALVNMANLDHWLNARWEKDTPHWFLSGQPMGWSGMAYMGMERFPDKWAWEMTHYWAVNDQEGFFTEVPLATRALKDWEGVSPEFTVTPDTCWWAIRGMYLHHVGTNANRCALGHLKGYNLEWGIPVAPEARDINFDPWGDQYSNFNAGKLLLILEGITGVDYSVPDGTFTVADHLPSEWSFMELRLPVTQPGRTDWVQVRVSRTDAGAGVVEKTVSVTSNPLPTLQIKPWLEGKTLVSAPAGYTYGPTNHIAYTFSTTTNKTLTIRLRNR